VQLDGLQQQPPKMFRRGGTPGTSPHKGTTNNPTGTLHGQMVAKAAASSIKEGRQTILELVDQDLGDNGVAVLAQSIKEGDKMSKDTQHETLSKVDIRKNNITDSGVEHLTELLATNHSVTEISLSENNITDNGATLFASVLSLNRTLLVLSL